MTWAIVPLLLVRVTLRKNCLINTLMIFPTYWTNMLSDTYKNAKSIRRQFERIWHKKKTPLNRARLRKQIARCNSLANKDKATYYRALVNENRDDPKKLWQVLRSTLHRIPDKVLPSNSSQKNWLISLPLFLPTRLLKSESLFPVLHPFPCQLLWIHQDSSNLMMPHLMILRRLSKIHLQNPVSWILGLLS